MIEGVRPSRASPRRFGAVGKATPAFCQGSTPTLSKNHRNRQTPIELGFGEILRLKPSDATARVSLINAGRQRGRSIKYGIEKLARFGRLLRLATASVLARSGLPLIPVSRRGAA